MVFVRNYFSGMYSGNFVRSRQHIALGPYEKDGIVSTLVKIPHHQDKNYQVPAKFFTNNQDSSILFLFFHAGGYVQDEYAQHDDYLREIAKENINVLSVLYRLAPEYKFPTNINDGYSSLVWIKNEMSNEKSILGKFKKIVIGGDSAGGNMASVVTIMNKENNLNLEISKNILIYPWMGIKSHYPENQHFYLLTTPVLNFYIKSYLGENLEEKINSPLVNPTKYKGSLSFLPKTIVITASYDPLKPDGELYHQRLLADGVDSKLYNFNSIHGYAVIPFIPEYKETFDLILNEIKN